MSTPNTNLNSFLDQLERDMNNLGKTASAQGLTETNPDVEANKTQGQGTKAEIAAVVGNVAPASTGAPAANDVNKKQNVQAITRTSGVTPNQDPEGVQVDQEKAAALANRARYLAQVLVEKTSAAIEKAASQAAPAAHAEESLDKLASDARAFVQGLPADAQEKIASAHAYAMERYQESFQAYVAQAHQHDQDIAALESLGLSKQAAAEALAELANEDPAALAPGAEDMAPEKAPEAAPEGAGEVDPAVLEALQAELIQGLESGELTIEELVSFLEQQGVDVNQLAQMAQAHGGEAPQA